MQNVKSSRCMYKSMLKEFVQQNSNAVLGSIVDSFHGDVQTTSIEAWKDEITLLQNSLAQWANEDAYIFFEYDIPRLSKRIDVVLLLRGIIFCLEFKVGKKDALQADLAPQKNLRCLFYLTDCA